jgi:hypothetical protein
MRVIVIQPDGTRTHYDGVTALGVGHLKQDLVIVQGDARPIELSRDEWADLEVERIEVSLPSGEPFTTESSKLRSVFIGNGDPPLEPKTRKIVFEDEE